MRTGNRVRGMNTDDVAAQFPGVEIEFNDKVTLFPVQLEKQPRPKRKASQALRRAK